MIPHETLRPPPGYVRSLDGQLVDVSGDTWQVRSSADGGRMIALRWPKLAEGGTLSNDSCLCVKRYLANRLVRRKPMTVGNDFGMFVRFRRWLSSSRRRGFDWADLSEGMARGFLSHGMGTADKGNDFSRLRAFYEWGVANEVPGFDPALLRILKRITAAGNTKGHHVRFRDPERGPFSPDELLLIRRAIVACSGTDRDRAVVMLHLELSHNALATARLKNGDLFPAEADLQDYFKVSPPAVHQMVLTLEAGGFIARTPGESRSIRLLIPRAELPDLE